MNQYWIRRVSNDWFACYLPYRNNYVSINGFNCSFTAINSDFLHGSFIGSLPFLLYINDLNEEIRFCKVYHFADDTNFYGRATPSKI